MADNDNLERLHERWRLMSQAGITLAALQAFYARYKYLIMSRHIDSYQTIGVLLANAGKEDLSAVAQRLFALLADALRRPETRGGNVNALLHISGYLKQHVPANEKQQLLDAIEKYRRGDSEFEIPLAMLRAHFQRYPNAYIEQQWFLYPHA